MTERAVDSTLMPIFGLEDEELVLLRKLADVVQEFLMTEDISHQDLGKALESVRMIQYGRIGN